MIIRVTMNNDMMTLKVKVLVFDFTFAPSIDFTLAPSIDFTFALSFNFIMEGEESSESRRK